MKHIAAFFTLLFSASISMASPIIGEQAPTFTLTDTDGTSHSLAEFKGKTVILEWTNHDCPFVRKHYDSNNMQSLQKKYTDDDVIWLSIISSAEGKQGHVSGDEANALTQSRNAHPTHVLLDTDGKIGRLYDARTTPHMYVIDDKGVLRYNGAIDSIRSADKSDIEKATNYVSLAMAEIDSNSPITNTLTRPYGCSIKY